MSHLEANESPRNDDGRDDGRDEHPVGVGVGTAGGAVAGTLMGSAVGPVGALAGAAIGGIFGGVAGGRAAESIDAAIENRHWQDSFKRAAYVEKGLKYSDYEPAYRFGWESYLRYPDRRFEDIQTELMRDWDAHRADSPLTWARAKAATQEAWERVDRKVQADLAATDTRRPYETNSTMDRGDR